MGIQPFKINIPQTVLDDLRTRLSQTRWPDQVQGAGWDYGTNLDYLKDLADYWQHTFDWRAQEARLNQFAHFRTEINGLGIHFIHARGQGLHPLPIILTHGRPSSFFEMLKIIPLLTDPARYGADPVDSFDVIVPSLPGFGFSDRPRERGCTLAKTAELWARLMTDELGYQRFGAAGGDFGSAVTRLLCDSDSLGVSRYLPLHVQYPHFEERRWLDFTLSFLAVKRDTFIHQFAALSSTASLPVLTFQGISSESLAQGGNRSVMKRPFILGGAPLVHGSCYALSARKVRLLPWLRRVSGKQVCRL